VQQACGFRGLVDVDRQYFLLRQPGGPSRFARTVIVHTLNGARNVETLIPKTGEIVA
jgi:hypothetical protein